MRRQLQGIGIILFSILMTMICDNNEWYLVDMFMTTFEWSHIFIFTGSIGFLMLFLPKKKDE